MPAAPVKLTLCPACQAPNLAEQRLCGHCGAPLHTMSGETSRATLAASSDGRASEPPDSFAPAGPDPLIGLVVAERYRILEPIGRGGMGVVYKVEHARIDKLMAMKLLAGELSRDREVVSRFKREALTASKLSHPNTVQVFDFGSTDGLTYLVMELLLGDDLGRALRQDGPMPFERLGRIVVQICGSLGEAHAAGIVHRDLKPENIFLLRGRDGEDIVKVLDFGLAKLRESSELNDVTSQGAIVGTPYYMSPEQIRGDAVDARSDVYALGALMYRALTGVAPFVGPSPIAVFTRHLTEEAVPPSDKVPELAIARGASDLVMRALAKEPEKRFQSVDELLDAVVEELKRCGASGVDELLNSGQMRELAALARRAHDETLPQGVLAPAAATRDEVAAYEQKLRRQRGATRAAVVLALAAAAGIGVRAYQRATAPAPFDGREREPNDQASDASELPFGRPVRGFVGKRFDATHSDRDFYAVTIPPSAAGGPAIVRMSLGALPNFAICATLYRIGLENPLGVYCAGRPARDLSVDALRLEPGRYLVDVAQDRDGYGSAPPFVFENVSDAYTLLVAAAGARAADREVEPNDAPESATRVEVGGEVRGTFAWMRDEDIVCVAGRADEKVRLVVRDAEKRPRDPGAVLESTPLAGGKEGTPARVHRSLLANHRPEGGDFVSPWTSDPMPGDVCVRLRLAADPWSDARALVVPPAGDEEWSVRVEPSR